MYWLIVIGHVTALEWIIANERMAFRDKVRTQGLSSGDRFAIYTARGTYGNPTKDESQIIALGTIASAVIEEKVTIGDETFARHCSLSLDVVKPLRHGIAFRPLVAELDFVQRSERRWPSAVHRTLVPLSEHDFGVIAGALNVGSD